MVTFANAIDSIIGISISGATNTLTIQNPSNTASSQAQCLITVGGATSGDVWSQYTIGSTTSWSMGLDNSDSDVVKLNYSNSASVNPSSGTEVMRLAETGQTNINFTTGADRAFNYSGTTSGFAEINVGNSNNTDATSDANFTLSVGGASGGDPQNKWVVSGANTYSAGISNANSDVWRLTNVNGLDSGTIMQSTTAGEVTFPLTPAFLATHSVAQNNVTGNGASVTVNYTTEVYDQNADYDGTNTFTSPVTGRYFLASAVFVNDFVGGTSFQISLVTSNRTYTTIAAVAVSQTSGIISTLADMDAADTCTVAVVGNGLAGNTADLPIQVSATYFCGNLSS